MVIIQVDKFSHRNHRNFRRNLQKREDVYTLIKTLGFMRVFLLENSRFFNFN